MLHDPKARVEHAKQFAQQLIDSGNPSATQAVHKYGECVVNRKPITGPIQIGFYQAMLEIDGYAAIARELRRYGMLHEFQDLLALYVFLKSS
jgi:hypothetical protein